MAKIAQGGMGERMTMIKAKGSVLHHNHSGYSAEGEASRVHDRLHDALLLASVRDCGLVSYDLSITYDEVCREFVVAAVWPLHPPDGRDVTVELAQLVERGSSVEAAEASLLKRVRAQQLNVGGGIEP